MEDDPREILKSLEPLFKRAREENLLFRCNYQGFFMFPDELAKANEEGRFIWGPSIGSWCR